MLLDDEEILIMANALQPPLRVQQSDNQFKSILQMFFAKHDFSGDRILELGPGQGDFSRLAMAAGAQVLAIDHDAAVVALALKRGYEALHADVLKFDWRPYQGQFDGLFVRHSIAAQWFGEPGPLQEFIDTVCSVLKPEGWGWLLPWNRFQREPDYIETMVMAQRRAFERNGFTTFELTPLTGYSDGSYDRWDLFLRGLEPAATLADTHSLRPYT